MGVKTIQRSPKQTTLLDAQVRMHKRGACKCRCVPVGSFGCSVSAAISPYQRKQCNCHRCVAFDRAETQQAGQRTDRRWPVADRARGSRGHEKRRRDKEEKRAADRSSSPLGLRGLQLTFGRRDEKVEEQTCDTLLLQQTLAVSHVTGRKRGQV